MAKKKEKEPEDLGIKMGTKEEVLWTEVKKNCQVAIENLDKELIINKELLKIAERRIKEEQAK